MKTLRIIRGPSGSGKSTFAKKNFPDAFQCEADDYFIDADGIYRFDAKLLGKAHEACQNMENFQEFPGEIVVETEQ